jgi:hypothetical protein
MSIQPDGIIKVSNVTVANLVTGAYIPFSSNALPAPGSGYLRQGTGPYSVASYPKLAQLMPAVANFIGNTGQGQAPVVAAKTGSNTMIHFQATNYGYTTNGGANWGNVTHSEAVCYQGDANQKFAFFPTYGGNPIGISIDLNNPATCIKRTLNDTLGYACTAAGPDAFLVNSVATGQRNIIQRSIDNFVTRANITLPANFLSNDPSGALIRGHYLTNTVLAVRDGINSNIIARSTNAGNSAVANNNVTFSQVTLPSAQTIAAIATDGFGKWLLAPAFGSNGFFSDDDAAPGTLIEFISPEPGKTFNIVGWDGLRWVMMSSGGTNFWYSTTGRTGTWLNKTLSPYTIFGNSFRCNPARMTDNSLWVPTNVNHTLVNTNLTGTNFTIPAVTEPTGSQLWVNAIESVVTAGLQIAPKQSLSFVASPKYIYPVDTTNNPVTAALPLNPSIGDVIQFTDYANKFATNNLIINPNGAKINSSSSNVIINTNNAEPTLTYIDATEGWALSASSQGVFLPTWTTTTTIIRATTTNPTKGTIDKDVMRYRKVGDKIYQLQISYRQTAGGAGGSGIYLYTLPAGLQFDLNAQRTSNNANANSVTLGTAWAAKISGGTGSLYVPGSYATIIPHAYDATRFYLVTVGGVGGASYSTIQHGGYFQSGQELWVDVDFIFTATT